MEAQKTDEAKEMETKKIIALGKWTVTQVVECESNSHASKTVVEDLSGRLIGKFDDSISVADARMIANAPNMLGMLMKMESEISSIVYNGCLPSWSYLCNLIYEVRCVIDNANGRK